MEAYIKAKYVERRFVQRRSEDEIRQKVLALSNQDKPLSSCSDVQPSKGPASSKTRPASGSSGKSSKVLSCLRPVYIHYSACNVAVGAVHILSL